MARGRRKVNSSPSGKVAFAEVDLTKESAETFDERLPEDDDKFVEALDELLETPFYSINKLIPQFRAKLVSPDARHWYVKWFFPNAIGGPVYVDYPRNKHDLAICEKKAEIMKDLKLTYKLLRTDEERRVQLREAGVRGEADAEIPAGEVF